MTIRMKSTNFGISLALLVSAALTPWAAKADWLNLTGAEMQKVKRRGTR